MVPKALQHTWKPENPMNPSRWCSSSGMWKFTAIKSEKGESDVIPWNIKYKTRQDSSNKIIFIFHFDISIRKTETISPQIHYDIMSFNGVMTRTALLMPGKHRCWLTPLPIVTISHFHLWPEKKPGLFLMISTEGVYLDNYSSEKIKLTSCAVICNRD